MLGWQSLAKYPVTRPRADRVSPERSSLSVHFQTVVPAGRKLANPAQANCPEVHDPDLTEFGLHRGLPPPQEVRLDCRVWNKLLNSTVRAVQVIARSAPVEFA